MSQTSRPGRSGPILALFGALLLVGTLFFLFSRSYPLERSAIGFEGLGTWLSRSGFDVKRFPPATDDPNAWNTLRILPLYDNDMSDTLEPAADEDETRSRLGALSPREMSEAAFEERVAAGMTLVILPKWRGGIVDRGRAHPDLLVPLDAIKLFGLSNVLVRPDGDPFRTSTIKDLAGDARPGSVTLYAPQALGPDFDAYCEPTWQAEGIGTLLAWCDSPSGQDNSFFVLSDPDILDNHGLTLGSNAKVALAMVRLIAPGSPIYVDPGGNTVPGSAGDLLAENEESFADPSRFFRYPFSLVWLGVAAMLLLALWRGNVRFGVARRPRLFSGFQSKRDTIRASGRLMRLAGDDAELVRAYAVARMEALSDMLLGRQARNAAAGDPASAVLRFLRHRAPELGARIDRAYHDLTIGAAEKRQYFAALAPFEAVLQEILNEFGRAPHPSRRDRR
ncbi:hypothetical protein [Mangrovicella endophytica]|uniref:hypothetical protein n=1 Tax=Mangrovicella endophytica TaxID=2066697 RepID=UPI000C9DE269|nr:hypothetical protein [Mangrovicella endophytica]